MNLQTNTSSSDKVVPLDKPNIFSFSWLYILIILTVNTLIVFIFTLSQITQTGFNTIGLLKLDLSFQYGLTPLYFDLLVSNGILLLGLLLIKFLKKPVVLIIFQLFCGFTIFGLYYSRLADDYFPNSQYIITSVIFISTVIVLIKLYQIIKKDILFKKTIWFWGAVLMILVNCGFLVNLLLNPTTTPAIFHFVEYNRSAQNKIDMQKIVPQDQFPGFTVTYTESKDAEKFQFPDFRADIDQNAQWGKITIRANVDVMIMRNIDTQRETMGNKIQLTPDVTAYYNCSCSSSYCSERQEKGQTQNESDQQCDISWRNGIYRIKLDTMGATLDKFIQMAKTVAKNSEYLK